MTKRFGYAALAAAAFASILAGAPAPGQQTMSMGRMVGPEAAPGGGGACPQATAALAHLTTTHSADYTTMICGLVSDGVWASLDGLWLMATDNAANPYVNLISPTSVGTTTGTVAFTANSGVIGTSGVINTTLNYSTTVNYQQDSATLSTWTTEGTTADNGCPIGEASVAFDIDLSPYGFGGNVGGAINTGGINVTDSTGTGLTAADRSSSSLITVYRNGASIGTSATTSAAPSNTTVQGLACAGANSYFGENVAMMSVGGSLGATKQAAFYNRIHTFLNAINGSLYP